MCSTLAWPFLSFDELSFVITLVCLLVWDIFAVRSALGPLRLISSKEPERMSDHHYPPGLLYETSSGACIGTGDLVFYSAASGRASMCGVAATFSASLGLLLGQFMNGTWSFVKGGDSVPALPLAYAFGLFCYLVFNSFVLPAFRWDFV